MDIVTHTEQTGTDSNTPKKLLQTTLRASTVKTLRRLAVEREVQPYVLVEEALEAYFATQPATNQPQEVNA